MPVTAERIPDVLDSYERDPVEALRRLDEIFQGERRGMSHAASDAVSLALRSRGAEFFVAYLLRRGELFPLILNPHALSMDDATSALKLAMRVEPGCDVALLESLARAPQAAETLTRLIDLAGRVRLGGRLRPTLETLLRHDNPFLSSKAELLLNRLDQAERILQQRLRDPDPRAQADAVESLWGEDTPDSREIFLRAVNSPSDRLLGNGLYGLYAIGDTASIRMAFDLAENQSPLVRPTAIWFMGQTGDPRFLPWLVEAMGTSDNRLRSRIFQAIRQIRERRAQAAAAGRLRMHILSATLTGKRERTIRFVLAGDGRPVIRRILATQLLLTESGRAIHTVAVRPTRLSSAAHVLLLCCGGAEPPSDLHSLLGPSDNLNIKIASAAGVESELQAFAAGKAQEAIILIGDGTMPELPQASALTEKLRAAGKRIHGVWPESVGIRHSLPMDALAKATGGLALRYRGSPAAGLEQAVLATLEVHELRYEADPPSDATAPIHLQAIGYQGVGEAASLLVRRHESNPE
jgi:hypothetical protein